MPLNTLPILNDAQVRTYAFGETEDQPEIAERAEIRFIDEGDEGDSQMVYVAGIGIVSDAKVLVYGEKLNPRGKIERPNVRIVPILENISKDGYRTIPPF